MARYRIRLDDPNSGEFRVVVTHAASEADAVAAAEALEAKYVKFRVPDDELGDLVERAATVRAAAGRLHAHHQREPYTVTSIREG